MRNTEALTLKAFLSALCQQRSPLSGDIQAKLAVIAQSLETRVMELDDLVKDTYLENPYKNARLWLGATAAQRIAGLKFLPIYDPPDEDNGETANTTRDTRESIQEMKQVLAKIESKFELNRASQILSASNSVQAAQNVLTA